MENLSREPKTLQKLPPTHKHTTKTPRTDNPSFTSLSRGCRRSVRADILKGINITGVSTSIVKTRSRSLNSSVGSQVVHSYTYLLLSYFLLLLQITSPNSLLSDFTCRKLFSLTPFVMWFSSTRTVPNQKSPLPQRPIFKNISEYNQFVRFVLPALRDDLCSLI